MTIERFTREQFLAALPEGSKDLGFKSGQYLYSVPVDSKCQIYVYSTIDSSGIARDTGDDSVRFVLLDTDFPSPNPLMAKSGLEFWITRVPGWQERMEKKINVLKAWRSIITNCKVCGEPRRLNKKKDGSSLYISCSDYDHKHFDWVKTMPTEGQSEEAVVKQSFTPVTMIDKLDLSRLNEDQLFMVNLKGKGPTVCSAGAGSGKTTVLIHTVANMILTGVDPSRILVVTFSSKAAGELRERIAKLLWPNISQAELSFYNPMSSTASDSEEKFDIEQFDTSREWVEANPIRTMLVDWVTTIHACSLRLLKTTGKKPIVCKGQW